MPSDLRTRPLVGNQWKAATSQLPCGPASFRSASHLDGLGSHTAGNAHVFVVLVV